MKSATFSIISITRLFQSKENILRWPPFRHIPLKGKLHRSKPEYRIPALAFSKLISCNSQVRTCKLDLTLQIRLLSSISLSLKTKNSRTSKGWLRQASSIQMSLAMVPQFSIAIPTKRASYRRNNNCQEHPRRAHLRNRTMLDKTSQAVTRKKLIKLVTMRRWSTLHQR